MLAYITGATSRIYQHYRAGDWVSAIIFVKESCWLQNQNQRLPNILFYNLDIGWVFHYAGPNSLGSA